MPTRSIEDIRVHLPELPERFEFVDSLSCRSRFIVDACLDHETGEEVVVKGFGQRVPAKESERARFRSEVEILRLLDHPQIPSLVCADTETDNPYLVMEKFEHDELYLEENRSPNLAGQLVASALVAVEYAHEMDVAHKDIKPDNLLISSENETPLIDFGISRRLYTTDISKKGIGTFRYMSPAQMRGEPVTRQDDIYSTGVTLYEMATGEAAFPGANNPNAVYAVLGVVGHLEATSAGPLRDIIEKATQADAKNRYSSTADMREDIETTLNANLLAK